MRGDSFHNDILVRRLHQVAEECGAVVQTEAPVPLDGNVGYADLLIEKSGRRVVGEAEQTWHRVGNDVRKAVALGAELLLIATPDSVTAQACRRQLRRQTPPDSKLKVIICPLGAALEILRQTLSAQAGAPAPVPPDPKGRI